MLAAIIILSVFMFFGFVFLAAEAYMLWTMHKRIEALADNLTTLGTSLKEHVDKVNELIKKVTEGENVIIENFTTLDKRVAKLEHEIKDAKHSEIKAKEALKAVSRFQRFASNKQADAV